MKCKILGKYNIRKIIFKNNQFFQFFSQILSYYEIHIRWHERSPENLLYYNFYFNLFIIFIKRGVYFRDYSKIIPYMKIFNLMNYLSSLYD